MESLEDKSSKEGFFKYVFDFGPTTKSLLLNISQYSLLTIIPIVLLNLLMQNYVPDADDSKSSLELTIEVLFTVIFLVLTLYLINRIIFYIPTFSKEPYQELNFTSLLLAIMLIIFSLQTKIKDKVQILMSRLYNVIYPDNEKSKKKTKKEKQSSQSSTQSSQATQQVALQNDPYSTNIQSLPVTQAKPMVSPNFDAMYQNTPTPLVGANTPIDNFENQIMAANEVLGGSFGSNF